MITLEQLQQIITISEKRTLTAAAQTLHISQPALSRSIQKLETELSAELFTRSKNRMELNETGNLVVRHAGHILEDVRELTRTVYETEQSKRRILVGSCAPAPIWILMPLLTKYFPYMTLSSEVKLPEEIEAGLYQKKYQAAVFPFKIKDEKYMCQPLCAEHLYLSVPPAHPFATRKGLYLPEIDGETMLLMTELGFWEPMVKEKMPNTKFLLQNEMDVLLELADVSALPVFSTDLALKFGHRPTNRVNIPILDKEANVSFYFTIARKEEQKYKKLMMEIARDLS